MNKSLIKLIAGFRKFKEKYFQDSETENSVYYRLASYGQTPKTLMIGCSDSRVDPAILTGAEPGELFVIRNVANLVPPCEEGTQHFHGTSSAIEFAVNNLKVENIVVLGHRQCGGIRALMSNDTNDDQTSFVRRWMNIAAEARKAVLANFPHADENTQMRAAEMESLKISIKNLKTFPFVQEAIDKGQLQLVAVYFDLEQGELWELDEYLGKFKPIVF